MNENCIRQQKNLCVKSVMAPWKRSIYYRFFTWHVHRTESLHQTMAPSAMFVLFFRFLFLRWCCESVFSALFTRDHVIVVKLNGRLWWESRRDWKFPETAIEKEQWRYFTCCVAVVAIEFWLSIFSDRRFATSFTSDAKLLLITSLPISNAPVKRFNAPVSLPSTSLNSLSPFSNCFHAINDVVSDSKRFFTLKIENRKIKWI